MNKKGKFVINPRLVFSFTDRKIIISNPDTKSQFEISNDLYELLFLFLKKDNYVELDPDVLSSLLENKILVTESSFEVKFSLTSEMYRNGYFSEYYLHNIMIDYPFLDYSKDDAFEFDRALMRKYATIGRRPVVAKSYVCCKKIQLGDFTTLDWNNIKLQKDKLGLLLSVSFGKTMEIMWPTHKIRKTVPSGGSKHPTEVYIIFRNNFIFPRGVYHYNSLNYSLEKIYSLTKKVQSFLSGIITDDALFVIVYTSVHERSMWRYRDIRSTRAILADMGHIVQGAATNFTKFGFIVGAVHDFDTRQITQILKLDENSESVYYLQYFL